MNDSPDNNTMKQMPRIKEEAMFSEREEDDYINFDYMLNIKRAHVHQKSQNGSNEELEVAIADLGGGRAWRAPPICLASLFIGGSRGGAPGVRPPICLAS